MASPRLVYEREQFKSWLASPKKFRKPATQSEVAKQLDVAQMTLSKWKDDPDFMDGVVKLARKRARKHTPFVIEALREGVARGNVRAMKLWLQYVEEWSEKNIADLGGETMIKVSWEDDESQRNKAQKASQNMEKFKNLKHKTLKEFKK